MAVAEIADSTSLIKTEDTNVGTSGNPIELEDRVLHLCAVNPKGVTDDMIIAEHAVNTEQRMRALQRLLSKGKIEVFRQGSVLKYKLRVSSTTVSKTKGFEKEEKLVYQIIEDSGNKGIWIRDIRKNSNLQNSIISKSIKTLESKKLIKSVKSVTATKKPLYMLYDLQPHETVTGGAWYSDQEFETEFVDVLNAQCLQFLQNKIHKASNQSSHYYVQRRTGCATVKEVCQHIADLKISKVALTELNIESILDTLVYDGKAEVIQEDSVKLYRASKALSKSPAFSRIPCGICPIIDQCSIGGAVSPSNCVYMTEWLTF